MNSPHQSNLLIMQKQPIVTKIEIIATTNKKIDTLSDNEIFS